MYRCTVCASVCVSDVNVVLLYESVCMYLLCVLCMLQVRACMLVWVGVCPYVRACVRMCMHVSCCMSQCVCPTHVYVCATCGSVYVCMEPMLGNMSVCCCVMCHVSVLIYYAT